MKWVWYDLVMHLSDDVLLVVEVTSSIVVISEKTLSEYVEPMRSPTENSSFKIVPV